MDPTSGFHLEKIDQMEPMSLKIVNFYKIQTYPSFFSLEFDFYFLYIFSYGSMPQQIYSTYCINLKIYDCWNFCSPMPSAMNEKNHFPASRKDKN